MRSPIEDANAGAATQVAPTKKHAVRTATIATQHNNQAQQKAQQVNAIASTLGGALDEFVVGKRRTEAEQRYVKAYHDQGTKAGLDEYQKDIKRTGFTEFIHGGQTPEYKGWLNASASNAANAMFSEEHSYIEGKGGDESPTEYTERLQNKVKGYVEENFAEAPDAAVAFMKNWKDSSNRLTKQQFKLWNVRQQQRARQDFKEGVQGKLTVAKQMIGTEPDVAQEVLKSIYNPNQRGSMSMKAWRSATLEETLVSMQAGDVSLIPHFNQSGIDLDPKEFKAYNAGLKKLDTDNATRLTDADNTLKAAILTTNRSGVPVEDSFNAYDRTVLEITARNTHTAKHMALVSKSDVHRGAMGKLYAAKLETEHTDIENSKLEDIKHKHTGWKLDNAVNQSNATTTDEQNTVSHRYMTEMLEVAVDPAESLKVRTAALLNVANTQTAVNANTKAGEAASEKSIASKANLLAAKFSLDMAKAKQNGEPPVVSPATESELRELLKVTNSDATRTLITNLLTNVETVTSGKAEEFRKAEADNQVSSMEEQWRANETRLLDISTNPDLDGEERADQEIKYISDTVKGLEDQLQDDSSHKKGRVALEKQINVWKKKLEGHASEGDRLAKKQAIAMKKEADNKKVVSGLEDAYEKGITYTGNATKAQKDQATDNLVMKNMRTTGMEDLTDSEVVDQVFTDQVSATKFLDDMAKYSAVIEDSPLIKKGLETAFQRIFTPNPDPDQKQHWSDENKKAVEVMQLINNNEIFNQLSPTAQQQSMFMVAAVNSNMDRPDVMKLLNTTGGGYKEPPRSRFGWQGVADELDLDDAPDQLQASVVQMYDYLVPKLGHEMALAGTRKLAQFQNLETTNMAIKYGATYKPIEYKTPNGKEHSITLKDFSNGIGQNSLNYFNDAVTGERTVNVDSAMSRIVQKLSGHAIAKDGSTITSLDQIPGGITAEVIGDVITINSMHNSYPISREVMESLAAEMHLGKEQYERSDAKRRLEEKAYTGSGLFR
tara:strand:+ start:8556 stop:11564 length:3009 start_codon:yes stop_codon:yes gene_type:complete